MSRIGNLNGTWSILLRVALATYPIVLAWGVWVTSEALESRVFRQRTDLYTITQAAVLEGEINGKILALHTQMPRDIDARVSAIERNHLEVIRTLARVEAKLEALKPVTGSR